MEDDGEKVEENESTSLEFDLEAANDAERSSADFDFSKQASDQSESVRDCAP